MTPDQIFIVVNDRRVSLAAFYAMDKATIKTVDASGCTALTSIDLPAAEYVDASGCTALTSIDLPAAKTVYARGCTALTSIDLPAAEYVDARGCTALTSVFIEVGENARGYPMWSIKLRGVWRIIAGCRNFDLDGARKHWGAGAPRAHPAIAAQVEEIAAEIAKRESVKILEGAQ